MRCLHLVMLLLPKGNRDTIEVLFVFLKWVASFSHVDEETGNRMDLHNLATVISPNIFRNTPTKGNDSVRVEHFEGIRVMNSLLEHQDEFFMVPEDFSSLLRDKDYFANCIDMPSRDFLKKCEMYYRSKQANGLRSPGVAMQGSTSANLASMGRDREGSDARLAQQKSDPSLRVRDGGRSPGFDRALAAPQPLERGSTSPLPYDREGTPQRNGHGGSHPNSRSQSPPPAPRLQHQPFSHPVGNIQPQPSPMVSQSFASSMPSGQPSHEGDWSQMAPGLSSPRPFAHAYTPRSSGEYDDAFAGPNGNSQNSQGRPRP